MKVRLATRMTWDLPLAVNRPDMGTYAVDGDCPAWQRKMRQTHGEPARTERVQVGSTSGRSKCWEPDCNGIHS